jgi:hypothetical protein
VREQEGLQPERPDPGQAAGERRAPGHPGEGELRRQEEGQRMVDEGGGPLALGEVGEGAGQAATRAGEMREAPEKADGAL